MCNAVNILKGKKISILGDSISTYAGVSNDDSANKTLFYNPYFCWYAGEFPVEKTYWKQVMDEFELELCVNNSWAGANLSGEDKSSSGVNRAKYLACDDGRTPDIVIVFMGLNDFGRRVESSVFEADYKKTLEIIKNVYDNPFVCCVNMPDRDIDIKEATMTFNEIIEKVVKEMGKNFFVADLFSRYADVSYYDDTVDGLHPDEDGMKIIAEAVIESIKENIS